MSSDSNYPSLGATPLNITPVVSRKNSKKKNK
jgi:hypothetical protein